MVATVEWRSSTTARPDLGKHLINVGSWGVQPSETRDRIGTRSLVSEGLLQSTTHPLAFGHAATLCYLAQRRIKFRRDQHLQPMVHISMLADRYFSPTIRRLPSAARGDGRGNIINTWAPERL